METMGYDICLYFQDFYVTHSNVFLPTGVREQLNGATSFLDGSAVYGSSKRESDSLRLFENGHLKTQADWLLPRATSHTCKDAMM